MGLNEISGYCHCWNFACSRCNSALLIPHNSRPDRIESRNSFLLPCHYTCNTHIHGSYRYRDCCRHSVRASQSLHIPPANLISEPVGAVACLVTYKALRNNFSLSPAPSTLIGTLVSGTTFVIVVMVLIDPAICPNSQPWELLRLLLSR